MRQKRAKAYKKQMNLYVHSFKFREPFQTIVDDEIISVCVKASYNLVKGLNRTIQAETKPMITQCCIQALYATKDQIAIDLAKSFERRRCNHPPKDPLTPAECIESITNVDGTNKHRYVVATQNHELRKKLRKVAGVPLVFMNRSVMVMEPVSRATSEYAEKIESSKLSQGLNDVKGAGYVNKPEKKDEESTEPPKKKKKGPKAPNPLSVKKKKEEPKKPETTKEHSEASGGSKRRRKHKKATNEGAEQSAETQAEADDASAEAEEN